MQIRPQNRFSFFDTLFPLINNVMKPRFSGSVFNTPSLMFSPPNPQMQHKSNVMNGLHRTPLKNTDCRVSGRTSERASISTVYFLLGVLGIVAERLRVVLIGFTCDPEPPTQLTYLGATS
jgi:hypothetical protein